MFIEEARIDENADEDLKEVLEFTPSTKINPIISDEKCQRYKVTFEDYLIYSVTDESFGIYDENEEFEGKLFRKYSKSKFLDYIQDAINIEYAEIFMGEDGYFHFGVCCLNQIIDVVSAKEPIIEKL